MGSRAARARRLRDSRFQISGSTLGGQCEEQRVPNPADRERRSCFLFVFAGSLGVFVSCWRALPGNPQSAHRRQCGSALSAWQALFESGNYPAAVKEFSRAVELNSKLPQLQSYYGRALLNTGDPVGAAAASGRRLPKIPRLRCQPGARPNLDRRETILRSHALRERCPAQPSRIH